MTAARAKPQKGAGAARTILQVLDDPNLFAPHFKGDTWRAWRAFLAALYALPMGDEALALYRHHTDRLTPPAKPFKEATLICGRRGGKSRVLALVATYLATVPDYSSFLAPGEVPTIAVIAADRKQARSIFRFITGLVHGTPLLKPMVETETTDTLLLRRGGTIPWTVAIEIHTASFRVTRGYTFAAVLADEVAFWRSEDSANPDEEILGAIRPGLSTIPTSMLLVASSPYAQRGALFKAFRQHYGRDDARVLVWRGTTAEMNPAVDPAIIAEAYEADPASAAAEYGAEFRNDVAAYVAREVVEDVTESGTYERPAVSGASYVAFVDPSGGRSDSMTLAIGHREGEAGVLDVVREVRPPFSPDAVVAEFATLLKAYGVNELEGDRWGGEWPVEAFQKQGITYTQAAKPKSDLYREMLPILNAGRCRLLDLPRLIAQLCGLERRTARGGRDSIDHAPGAHDDIANVVAGVLVMTAGQEDAASIWAKVGAGYGSGDLSGGWRLPGY